MGNRQNMNFIFFQKNQKVCKTAQDVVIFVIFTPYFHPSIVTTPSGEQDHFQITVALSTVYDGFH